MYEDEEEEAAKGREGLIGSKRQRAG